MKNVTLRIIVFATISAACVSLTWSSAVNWVMGHDLSLSDFISNFFRVQVIFIFLLYTKKSKLKGIAAKYIYKHGSPNKKSAK